MECHKKMRVECLDWPEAWKLFKEKVGQEALNSHPEISKIAEDVAKECAGLPLALITIGRAMAGKKTPQAWSYALTILQRSASQFSGMTENVYYKLKFSYDSLEDDTIKSCFWYCSLFPEDYPIPIKKLIRYWIGEGFLDGFDTIDGAQNKGYDIIENLKQACLLESVLNSPKEQVRMHDVLRDLALWIGRGYGKEENKLLVRAGEGLTEVPEVGKWEEAESISLMENRIQKLEVEAPKCDKLLTLIVSKNRGLYKISNDFFQCMPVLRVLDLSRTSLPELPTSIGELVNLQFLDLGRTRISVLPKDMKKLVKLKYLGLRRTVYLRFIPCGVLSVLSKLQVLDLSQSHFEHWEAHNGVSIGDLENLRSLKCLSIRIKSAASLKRLLDSENLRRCTKSLHINECLVRGILKLGCLPNICELKIEKCNQLEGLLWLSGAQNLESLDVSLCHRLARDECFPNLSVVVIQRCDVLKNLSWLRGAPKLETLKVEYCQDLQLICDGERSVSFPNLHEITITSCHKLKDLSWLPGVPHLKKLFVQDCKGLQLICDGKRGVSFQNLQDISISQCPSLKDLSWLLGVPNLEKLYVGPCEGLQLICDGNEAKFSKLREVWIHCFSALLKDLSWLRGAPNLEKLSIRFCYSLELIHMGEDTEGGESQMTFRHLSSLSLERLPELKSIPWHLFPSNTQTSIKKCPKATNTQNEEEDLSEDENDEEEDVEDEEEDVEDEEEDLSEDENDEEEDVEDEEEDEEVLPDEEEDCSDLEAGNEDENVEEKDVEVLPKKRRRLE